MFTHGLTIDNAPALFDASTAADRRNEISYTENVGEVAVIAQSGL